MMGTPGHLSLASSTHLQSVKIGLESGLWELAHLVLHIVQGIWCVDREANQNNVCL